MGQFTTAPIGPIYFRSEAIVCAIHLRYLVTRVYTPGLCTVELHLASPHEVNPMRTYLL